MYYMFHYYIRITFDFLLFLSKLGNFGLRQNHGLFPRKEKKQGREHKPIKLASPTGRHFPWHVNNRQNKTHGPHLWPLQNRPWNIYVCV
jgi:hypothetical protein